MGQLSERIGLFGIVAEIGHDLATDGTGRVAVPDLRE